MHAITSTPDPADEREAAVAGHRRDIGVDYEELQRTYDDPSFALVHGALVAAWGRCAAEAS